MVTDDFDPADAASWLARGRTPEHAAAIAAAWRDFPDLPSTAPLDERMQRGRASPAFDGGVFSPVMDVPTHCFHKWAAQRLL